jgi:hypothetical protein
MIRTPASRSPFQCDRIHAAYGVSRREAWGHTVRRQIHPKSWKKNQIKHTSSTIHKIVISPFISITRLFL